MLVDEETPSMAQITQSFTTHRVPLMSRVLELNQIRISEKLLLLVSRKPESNDYPLSSQNLNLDNALDILCNAFPLLLNNIKDKIILDFGCGSGAQTTALVNRGAKSVVGLDTSQNALEKAVNYAKEKGIENRIQFKDVLGKNEDEKLDIIVSQNSMENFKDPLSILTQMKTSMTFSVRCLFLDN